MGKVVGAPADVSHNRAAAIVSVSLATNAVCAGFEHVSGDAVHRTLSGLENAYRFEARDLFTHLLKRRLGGYPGAVALPGASSFGTGLRPLVVESRRVASYCLWYDNRTC